MNLINDDTYSHHVMLADRPNRVSDNFSGQVVGTEGYQAPELLEYNPPYSCKVDVYSLRMTIQFLGGSEISKKTRLASAVVSSMVEIEPSRRSVSKEVLDMLIS